MVKTLCPALCHSPKTPETDGRKIHGEDEEAVWYLTKAMAASSLQNSSSTITPSRSVMWSMLQRQTWVVRGVVQTAPQKTSGNTGHTYVMPAGSKPKSLFLTSSSLGVKSGIR